MRIWIVLLLTFVISGCNSTPSRSFKMENLAKSDVDMVTDLHRQHLKDYSQQLLFKLYKRNPRELKKQPGATTASRMAQLFPALRQDKNHRPLPRVRYTELNNKDGVAAISLAFAPDFAGDRVFALMVGITGMLNASYDHRYSFYLTDKLDQQKLYRSARNLETVAWLLRSRKDTNGAPLILSNGATANGIENLSFERLLGKMIANQDLLAQIIADSSSRTLNRVIHGAASMTLLPI